MGEGASRGRLCQTVAMRRLAHVLGAGVVALTLDCVPRRRPQPRRWRRRRPPPRRVAWWPRAPRRRRPTHDAPPPPRTTTTTSRPRRRRPPPPDHGGVDAADPGGATARGRLVRGDVGGRHDRDPRRSVCGHRCTRGSAWHARTGARALARTAMPGELGNVVLAGHRTSHNAEFRHLDQPRRRRRGRHVDTLAGRVRATTSSSTEIVRPRRCGSSTRRRPAPPRSSPATRRDRCASASSCTWTWRPVTERVLERGRHQHGLRSLVHRAHGHVAHVTVHQ